MFVFLYAKILKMENKSHEASIEHNEVLDDVHSRNTVGLMSLGDNKANIKGIPKGALTKHLGRSLCKHSKGTWNNPFPSLKEYKKAVMGSLIGSMTIVMDGNNITLLA